VGSIVDLRLGFIAEPNDEAIWGYICMHGDDECIGNILQLCVQVIREQLQTTTTTTPAAAAAATTTTTTIITPTMKND